MKSTKLTDITTVSKIKMEDGYDGGQVPIDDVIEHLLKCREKYGVCNMQMFKHRGCHLDLDLEVFHVENGTWYASSGEYMDDSEWEPITGTLELTENEDGELDLVEIESEPAVVH